MINKNHASEALTKEQLEFYRVNGYLVVPDVLTTEECDAVMNLFETESGLDFSEVVNPHQKYPLIMGLMKKPRAVAVLETIQNSRVCGMQSMFVWKKAGAPDGRKAWSVHQDATYVRTARDTYVGGDYIIDDHDPENGGLFFYAGSHAEPLVDFEPAKSEGDNPGNRVKVISDKYKKVDLVAKKGSMLIIHGHVMHGSYPNNSKDRSRPVLLQAIINEGAEFYRGEKGNRVAIPLWDTDGVSAETKTSAMASLAVEQRLSQDHERK